MCENCYSLKTINGYIPPYGNDYSSMFRNCSSLDIDVSKLFKNHSVVDGKLNVVNAYSEIDGLRSYNMSSIAYMFDGCKSLYSSDNVFDLAMIVDKCITTLNRKRIPYSEHRKCIENAFNNSVPLVMNKNIDDLGSLIYNIESASERKNAVKYAASEKYYEEYGIESDYMKILYPNGFLRYCGTLSDDSSRFIAVIYYPEYDSFGNLISLKPKTIGKTIGLSPEGFSDKYNVAQSYSNSTWYNYDYEKLYAAIIFDANKNEIIKYAYVGEYDLIRYRNDTASSTDRGIQRETSIFRVPVSVFSGSEASIQPLSHS